MGGGSHSDTDPRHRAQASVGDSDLPSTHHFAPIPTFPRARGKAQSAPIRIAFTDLTVRSAPRAPAAVHGPSLASLLRVPGIDGNPSPRPRDAGACPCAHPLFRNPRPDR
ncbi:hypothetical protein LUTEI9C_80038 [Luteimonas sp. 9C]|nr:hypothetical protein LUTEI9C_80038 [Luteimonas sp. 9C]